MQLGFHCSIEKSDNHHLICNKETTCPITTQARVVGKLDIAIHWIYHHLVNSVVCFVNTYPLDSDLSAG